MNNDPAYRPAGVSAICGGLCPELVAIGTLNGLGGLSGEVQFWDQVALSENHEFVVNYIYMIFINQIYGIEDINDKSSLTFSEIHIVCFLKIWEYFLCNKDKSDYYCFYDNLNSYFNKCIARSSCKSTFQMSKHENNKIIL